MPDWLRGVRVLDCTRLLPGPYCTLLLADAGADVIKIEEPTAGDPVRAMPPFVNGESARFTALNRNKRSVALDLQRAEGRRALLALAETGDVFVEGFRPGVAARLGVDEPAVRAVNPEVIYISLSGYGQTGPRRDHVGHDLNYLAAAGALTLGSADRPEVPGAPVADFAGATLAAFAIVSALHGGGGDHLDVSLADAAFAWLTPHIADAQATGRTPRPEESALGGGFACYRIYETRDGKYLSIGALEPTFWARLCEVLEVPEYAPLQYDRTRRAEIIETFETMFRARPLDEWIDILDPTEVPVAPVHDLDEALADEHVRARGLIRDDGGVAFPVRATDAPDRSERAAPRLGEHTRALLAEHGYSRDELDSLAAKGVTSHAA